MGTVIRNEVSENNPYHISKHRTLELRHFCAQYPEWQAECYRLTNIDTSSLIAPLNRNRRLIRDPVGNTAVARIFYTTRMNMLKKVAFGVDPVIGKYILIGVTEQLSYDKLNARYQVPCCKDEYYKLYRKFFWMLSEERQ